MNDMDAFKELIARSPDVELMNLDELHALVFWSGAAMKWARTQIEIAKQLGGLTAQIDAWAQEGNAAADLNFAARQRRGKLAKDTEQAQGRAVHGDLEAATGGRSFQGKQPSGQPPKWRRLGYKSEKAMKDDEFLHNNPKVVEKVKKQAKEAGDFPSVTAVKNEVRAQRAEKIAAEAKARAVERRIKETDEEIAANTRFVAEYFRTVKLFAEEVEKAIIGAEKGKFDPAGKNFVIEKHNKLRDLLLRLEALI